MGDHKVQKFKISTKSSVEFFENKSSVEIFFEMGEVVLITGCSRGIGLGLVEYFARAGFKVVATCRSPDKSVDLAKLLEKHGQAPALPLDTTSPASLLKNHPNDPPEQLDVAEMTNVFATNVGGTCAATQAFLPLLRKIFPASSSLYFLFPGQHLKEPSE